MTLKWFPWTEAKGTAPPATNQGEPISEPPCKLCKHFNPQVAFNHTPDGLTPGGVRLCHAKSMHFDFSCFRNREGR